MLPNLTVRDLKEIATLESLAPHLKKYIERELDRRTTVERDNLE
jgi:hypothetical protein